MRLLHSDSSSLSMIRILIVAIYFFCSNREVRAVLDQRGEYEVQRKELYVPHLLHSRKSRAVVVYPKHAMDDQCTHRTKFPLVIFAHGIFLGGPFTYTAHHGILNGIASFGFIVVAPRFCNIGCPKPFRWYKYDDEILKLLAFIDSKVNDGVNDDPIFSFVNHSAGYGIVGHSYGGQATARLLEVAGVNATINIKAGVILHPKYVNATIKNIPTAVFTSTNDFCCGEGTSKPIYKNIESSQKVYANMINGRHIEPNRHASKWTTYVVAWLKLFLSGNNTSASYYYDIIYNKTNPKSLCGGNIPMKSDCQTLQ